MADVDPALGLNVSLDPDFFRQAVRAVMQMGAPPDAVRRATFVFKSTGRTYRKNGVDLTTPPRLDRDGRPYDPEVEVILVPPREVTVDCAVEVSRAEADELPVGNFRRTRLTVTLLDEQYALVRGARELRYNGDRYLFGYEPEAVGLFSVGVFTMIFYALDES